MRNHHHISLWQWHVLVFCLTLLLPTASSLAQAPSYFQPWQPTRYTVETGLPSNEVLTIAETPSQEIWAGTRKGLATFDGYEWHAVNPSIGIPADPILLIESFGYDSVLVLTNKALYRGNANGFTPLLDIDSTRPVIQSVVVAAQSDIYALIGQALFRFEHGRPVQIATPQIPLASGLGKNLWRTSSGTIWLNTIQGLYRGNGTSWSPVLPTPLSTCYVTAIIEDKSGNGFAAVDMPSPFTGIWEWRGFGKASKSRTERARFPQTMDMGPDGTVIVVYQSGDVRIRKNGQWSSENAPPRAFATTRVIKFRSDGKLWVGTDDGLYLLQSILDYWEYWKYPFGDLRNHAHSICKTRDGSIWVGTLAGIDIHRPNGRVDHIAKVLGTTLNTVTAITEDRKGHVWIGSGADFEGSYRWDGRAWKHYGFPEGLRAVRVHKIRLDRTGRLWFLGLARLYDDPQQPGAFVLENGTFTNIPQDTTGHKGLISGRVYCFAEAPDGAIWFGTYKGLSRWKNNKWTHWTGKKAFQNTTDRIYALAVDSVGTLWFSNEISGLGTVDSSDNLRFFTTDDGLVNNNIWDLQVDAKGALWIATKGGMSCFQEDIWTNFTLRNGLSSLSLWDILPLQDKIYVGTRGSGVSILRRTQQIKPPRIRFEEPSIRGKTAFLHWKTYPFFGHVDLGDFLYRYRLDGGVWSEWQGQTEIDFANLKPGEHKVEVQTRGFFGVLQSPLTAPAIIIDPPLFMRIEVVFPIAILAGTIAFLGGAYWRRELRHKRQLEQSDELFHLLASTTTDVIIDWNFASDSVWANDPLRAFATVPSPRAENAFRSWLANVHPDDRERVRRSFLKALIKRTNSWGQEYRLLREDGTYAHTLNRFQILYNEAGKPHRLIGSGVDITDRKNAEDLTRNLTRHILEAQERERRRVSRELHDSVNQILASVKFRLESLEEQLPSRSVRVKRETKNAKQLLKKVMVEVRRISRNLRPAELDDLGLASAIRALAEEFTERTKIAVTILEPWPALNLPTEITVTLYRIIQEALTNVEKHSNATGVKISCSATDKELICTLSDNGRGMQMDSGGRVRSKDVGLGLVDIRERLSFLRGRLEISSRGRRGTTLTARIPLSSQSPDQQGKR